MPKQELQIRIIEQLKQYYKLHKGVLTASVDSYDWFDSVYPRRKDLSVQSFRDKFMLPGKMYRFGYDPLHKHTLPFYDKNPIIISFGAKKYKKVTLDIGLNINFLPRVMRVYFVDRIFRAHESTIIRNCAGSKQNSANEQGLININYTHLLKLLEMYGMGYAIRSYYPSHRMKTATISYENWYKGVAMRPVPGQFVKTGIGRISKRYRAALNI
jgi:hypothetical protein